VFVCGGDIIANGARASAESAKTRWGTRVPTFLAHSISEYRDISHDEQLFRHLDTIDDISRFDLVWERSSRLHCSGMRISQKYKIPYVMEWKDHLVDYDFSVFHKRALRIERWKLKRADFVVVESKMLAGQLSEKEGIPISKFIPAVNAVDTDEFFAPAHRRRMRDRFSFDDRQFVVGYVGSFAFYHGMDLLCDVIPYLEKLCTPKEVIFVLLGDGQGRINFENKVRERKMGKWFCLLGSVPMKEVPAYLSMFDCAVLPDTTDIICPIKVFEYMAAELPVVIPDYEANREIITAGQDGVLFGARNPKLIAESILELKKNPLEARRIGREARKKTLRDLSWESTWGAALGKVLDGIQRKA
jgi:glycosyltransferase involved in cell wall biosynthesis